MIFLLFFYWGSAAGGVGGSALVIQHQAHIALENIKRLAQKLDHAVVLRLAFAQKQHRACAHRDAGGFRSHLFTGGFQQFFGCALALGKDLDHIQHAVFFKIQGVAVLIRNHCNAAGVQIGKHLDHAVLVQQHTVGAVLFAQLQQLACGAAIKFSLRPQVLFDGACEAAQGESALPALLFVKAEQALRSRDQAHKFGPLGVQGVFGKCHQAFHQALALLAFFGGKAVKIKSLSAF